MARAGFGQRRGYRRRQPRRFPYHASPTPIRKALNNKRRRQGQGQGQGRSAGEPVTLVNLVVPVRWSDHKARTLPDPSMLDVLFNNEGVLPRVSH
jgi:hypothetical protein